MSRAFLILIIALPVGCASSLRFKDQPIVRAHDDARDIPEPKKREYGSFSYMADVFVLRRALRELELRDLKPARGINALDEVPDSTWFTNRIGVREYSPEQAARGPCTEGPPKLPLVIISAKSGGGNPGFVVRDQTKRKFLIKFDTPISPEQQTATDVIVSRLFYLLGYNVPADYILEFQRGDISVAEEEKTKFRDEDIDLILTLAPQLPNGGYRALASELLPGKPVGGLPPEGVREDDANDTIPHEFRRELRALKVFGAWVNHTDMKEDNTLDVYVEEDGRHFLRHYLVDFGEAFAGHASEKGRNEDGYENFWDWKRQSMALFAFGLWVRPWEQLTETKWPSVGNFSADHFDPEQWKEAYPYWPIIEADEADTFWGAKLIMRIDRPMLEAIVDEAKLADPDAAKYLVDTLLARRDKLGKVYFDKLSPLDELHLEGSALCGTDLAVKYGFASLGVAELVDEDNHALKAVTADVAGHVCLPLPADEPYSVMRVQVRRGKKKYPVLQVHLHGGSTPRILGIERMEDE